MLWLVCTLAWFFDGYEQASPAAILPFQFQEFHFTALSSGLIISSTGIGLLIGSYLFGYLSDRLGRRTVFQIDLLIYSIFGGLRIFATGWIDLFIYTLIGNAGIAGMFAVDAAYMAEYLPPKNRGKWQAAMVVTLVIGFIFVAAFMPVVPLVPTLGELPFGWRLIPLIGALPAFLIFWARRTLPESVRFLLSKGRVEEAAKIVARLEASAGPNYHYDGPIVAPQLARIGKANPKLFFVRPYVFYTIPLWLGWLVFYFVQTAQFFMPTVFMMGLGGGVTGLMSTVIIVELTNASKITARVFTALTIDRLGRRGNMFIGCALGAIGMAAWAYPWAHRTEVPFLYVIVPGMLSLWSDCWFMAFTASSSELYPIEARSMAYGWGTGVGRLGAVFGPLFMVALLANIELFFYSIAACWFIVLVITWMWIPETAKARIEESSKETVFKTAAET
jgi:putative MFS transporter